MKKLIAILLAAMLLVAAAQAEAALPDALERDAEAAVDLDGDGAKERVSWTMAEAEDVFWERSLNPEWDYEYFEANYTIEAQG